MNGQRTVKQATSTKDGSMSPPVDSFPGVTLDLSSNQIDARLHRKYRDLICKHLDKPLDRLFAEFTGLHPQISWGPAPAHEWQAENLPSGCSTCCRLMGAEKQPRTNCRNCGPRQLRPTLKSSHGHVFTCRFLIRNYWLPVRVRGKTLGIAYLQAPAAPDGAPGRHHSTRASRFPRNGRAALRHHLRRRHARGMTRSEFVRAARLLQHIVEEVQTASLADLRKHDLAKARRALRVFQNVEAELRKEHSDALLELHKPAPPAQPESRPQQIVRRLLERIESDYVKSITLRHYARELDMNPAYLSALFSQVVGLPFKAYLTGLRMDKAKAMLGDPAKNPSQVAYAVGYTSENRFRSVFKKVTGLPPKMWREAMWVHPPPPAASPSASPPCDALPAFPLQQRTQ